MGQYFTEERDGWIRDAVANGCVVLTKLTAEERAKVGGEPFFTGAGRPPIRKWVQVRVSEPGDVRALALMLKTSYERALAEQD